MSSLPECPAPEAARWHALVRRLAAEVHPGWLPDWPDALVRQAKASTLGCRMISVRLGATVAPALFCAAAPPPAAVLQRHPWLHLTGAELREAVLDVGAMAMSPAIHTVVRRGDMRTLRRSLGEARYRLALQVPLDSAPSAAAEQAQAALRRCLETDAGLAPHVQIAGLIEIGAALADEHPALLQRLRIAFPPSQALKAQVGWLDKATVRRALARRAAPKASAPPAAPSAASETQGERANVQ
ncbi:MAG: hypothetical protein AAGD86_11045 [Pseudomonadota bacterium]